MWCHSLESHSPPNIFQAQRSRVSVVVTLLCIIIRSTMTKMRQSNVIDTHTGPYTWFNNYNQTCIHKQLRRLMRKHARMSWKFTQHFRWKLSEYIQSQNPTQSYDEFNTTKRMFIDRDGLMQMVRLKRSNGQSLWWISRVKMLWIRFPPNSL